MIDILDKYKNRLVNISGRNRSLVTKKLYKKRAFDLNKLDKFKEGIDEDIVNFIISRKSGRLEIIDDPMKIYKEESENVERYIEQDKKYDLNNLKYKKFDDKESYDKEVDKINAKYEAKLIKDLETVKSKTDDMADSSNSINNLMREINSLEKETGRYELYIGYPFVEGYFKDGTFVKSPLLLFPIKAYEDKGKWYLENGDSEDVILNKVFLIALSKYNKAEIEEIETEYENIKDTFKDIKGVIEYLEEFNINIKYDTNDATMKFKETKKDTVIPYKKGELVINPYVILGQFPLANSIYNDYQELIKYYGIDDEAYNNLLLNKLLLNDKKYADLDLNEENSYYRNKDFSEKDFYLVSSLDYSQEKALKKVNETDQLVIYGPPGTGKSQTIANVIADSLAKDKKVLMVSQKRAALDVIYNRLGNLNSKTILIHDSNKDKKTFYQKVVLEVENAIKTDGSKVNRQIKSKAKAIDEEIEKLSKLGEVLSKKRDFGITLQQMYALTKNVTPKDKIKYDKYRAFRNNNFATSMNYSILKEIKSKVIEGKTWDYYKSYRDLRNEYDNLSILVSGLDNIYIEDLIDNLNLIKTKYGKEIKYKINDEKYILRYKEIFKALDQEIKDEDIIKLAEKINNEENSVLLNPLSKDDFLNSFKEKEENFDIYFALYRKLHTYISDDKIINLTDEINNEKNGDLLRCVTKEDYLSDKSNDSREHFDIFFDMYDDIENDLDETLIENLAKDLNEKNNKYLFDPLTKEDYLESINLTTKKYFNRFYDMYSFLEEEIYDDKISELAKIINEEENGYLLKPIEYGNWWTLDYWKNKKENKQKELDNKSRFREREDRIESSLLEYKKEITNYVKDTKENNKREFELRNSNLNKLFISYRNEIKEFVSSTQISRKNEFKIREEKILNEFYKYRDAIDEYAKENMFKNKEEYLNRGEKIKNILQSYKKSIEEFRSDILILEKIIKKDFISFYKNDAYKGVKINKFVDDTISALRVYTKYNEVLLYMNNLKSIEKDFLDNIYKFGNYHDGIDECVDDLFQFIILYNISIIEKEENIDLIIYKDFEQIVDKTNKLMREKQKLTPDYIVGKLNEIFDDRKLYSSKQDIKEFQRQAKKKRMIWAIRKYLFEYKDILLDLFPCWLLAPETVSEILPLVSGMFDIVIFDEASQMFIENAIPTIYRGKKVVIAGDDKQLRPTSMFKTKVDDEDEEVEENEVAAALEEESLLDLAKVNYDSVYLNYHYRSKYDELINFSNYAFYNGRLEVSPNIIKTDLVTEKPIERIKVDGSWIERKNVVEAEEVVKLVKNILLTRKKNQTIGIITFNISQQDLIEDMLDNECNNDPIFKNLYLKEKNRVENNEDVSLFVKNIENVQGDERDIIIFSIGYGKNEKDKVSLNFGSLSQDGGANRLNVAISRAKEKIYVITSIEPSELGNVDNTKNNGPKLFKKYLEYVKFVSEGAIKDSKVILNSLIDTSLRRNTVVRFDSPFEEEVYNELIKHNLNVDTQVGVSGYKIDLAIYDGNSNKYVLGIECDGAAYHSSKVARERDIHRQRYLESRGWNIIRIWSKDWWENPKNEIDKIIKYLKVKF